MNAPRYVKFHLIPPSLPSSSFLQGMFSHEVVKEYSQLMSDVNLHLGLLAPSFPKAFSTSFCFSLFFSLFLLPDTSCAWHVGPSHHVYTFIFSHCMVSDRFSAFS